jgi:KDO2-lipid IV(A) lauroyltransferase
MALVMAITPFRAAYVLADFIYLILYYLVGYRKKVVIQNLKNSFPQKSGKERTMIARRFYHHLSDIFIEGIKGISITRRQVFKRHRVVNPEILQPYFDKNVSVIGVTGHYGNWEWGAFSGGVQVPHSLIALYKPLSNPYLDRFMRKRRASFNCRLASIKETYATFEGTQNETVAYMMVADQSPTNLQDSHWVKFLNQDTACLHGPEKYARLYRLPVFYVDIQKKKRGIYELTLSLMAEDANLLEPGELTGMFMKHLEQIIIRKPEFWLWSHRRWKHKKNPGH